MGIYEKLKDLSKLAKEAGRIDLKLKLLDAMEESLGLQKKLQEKDRIIEQLKDKLEIKDDLIFKDNAYWRKSNNDGPFCMRCWNKHKESIKMRNDKDITYYCYECKNVYHGPNYEAFHSNLHAIPSKPRRDWGSF